MRVSGIYANASGFLNGVPVGLLFSIAPANVMRGSDAQMRRSCVRVCTP